MEGLKTFVDIYCLKNALVSIEETCKNQFSWRTEKNGTAKVITKLKIALSKKNANRSRRLIFLKFKVQGRGL